MRPDAARYMRRDLQNWMRPDAGRFLRPGTEQADVFPALDRKYSPTQRRVPAGNGRESGRWTDGRGQGGGIALPMGNVDFGDVGDLGDSPNLLDIAPSESPFDGFQLASDDGKPLLDIYGEPYYAPGGHHELPKSIFEKWDLPQETRNVFDQASIGALPRGRVDIDGTLKGHFWDSEHREYKDATAELSGRFLRENNIEPNRMTPDQARDLLKEIREAEDPRIRNYNRSMRMLRRIFRFRGGRE